MISSLVARGATAPTSSSSDAAGYEPSHGRTTFQPKLPSIPDRVFNVKQHGAVGDGVAVETTAIQATIDAAKSAGGGIVELPAGVYLSGPIRLASRINLRIDAGATLLMLPLDKYPGGTQNPENFISGSDLHDVALSGSGTIDGQGEPWWPFAKTKGANRPRLIAVHGCERLLIENLTLKNSPMFHIAVSKIDQMTVRGLTVRAPASDDPKTPSHNTDACDVGGKNILIENCDISVGDDNFTCGGNTSNVLIRNCKYGYGHGVSIGSYTTGEVSNITVVDCTFDHTDCGIRIKSDRDRGGNVHHMRYENLRMTNVGYPILIYGAYMAKEREYRDLNKLTPEIATRYPAAPVGPKTPQYHDFIFRNITATVLPGKRAGLIWGLPEAPARDIRLENVRITADLPFGVFNAKSVELKSCKITTPAGVEKLVTGNAELVGAAE